MNIKELSDAELYALMNETCRQLELCEGMEVIAALPHLKAIMRKHAANHRAALNELAAEYDSRRQPVNLSLDELRAELADFA